MINTDIKLVKEYSKFLTRTLRLNHQNRTHNFLYSITQSARQSYKQLAIFQYHYKALEPTLDCFYAAGYHEPIKVCLLFIGTLNEPHYKCHNCGKEEWKHKI